MICRNCGCEIDDNAKYCPQCGAVQGTDAAGNENVLRKGARSLARTINGLADGSIKTEIHFGDLFSGIFRKHSAEERDRLFICGTRQTTPDVRSMNGEWPKPWLHTRIFIVLLIAAALTLATFKLTQNPYVIPSMTFFTGLLLPFPLMIFFWECNVPRNISIFKAVEMFFLGGVFVMLIDNLIERPLWDKTGTLQLILVAIIQEVVKTAAVAFCIYRLKPRFILNGSCIGACIGAGFATLVAVGRLYYMGVETATIVECVFMTAGHVLWSAIIGSSLVMAQDGDGFKPAAFTNVRFIISAAAVLVLHILYSVLPGRSYYMTIVISFVFALYLVSAGLKQCNSISSEAWDMEFDEDMEEN